MIRAYFAKLKITKWINITVLRSYSQYTLKIMDGGSVVCFELMYKYEFMEWWNPDPVSIVLKDESRFVYPSYFCCCWFSIFYFVWMTNHLTHIRIWHRSNVTSSLPNIVGKIKLNCKTFAIAKCCHIHKSPFHLIKQNTIFKK